MDIQENDLSQGNQPEEPDEGWWASVLADEPMVESEIEPQVPHIARESCCAEVSSYINWEKVQKIYAEDEIIELNVVGYNRGGVLVAAEDLRGFVPASHLIDVPAESVIEKREAFFTQYLDRCIPVKIIECEQDQERIVFSERAALAGEGQRLHLLQSLNPGDKVEGIVTNVTDFGVFVDLGGLEGLIHVSELSWGRVQHPSDILNLEDQVRAMVLQVSEDKGRIALSLKRLEENPWETLTSKLDVGEVVSAEITNIVRYGAFARIKEGVEGLIHISSMNFPQGCTRIDDFLYEGQQVRVCILNLDAPNRRLGLKLERYSSD